MHGTDTGVAVSADEGRTWTHRGIAQVLEYAPGRMAYWAPEVITDDDGTYHMYVSPLPGVRDSWTGDARLRHRLSGDPLRRESRSALDLAATG